MCSSRTEAPVVRGRAYVGKHQEQRNTLLPQCEVCNLLTHCIDGLILSMEEDNKTT